MPQTSRSFHRNSGSGLTVTGRDLPGRAHQVYLCLAGEVDRDSRAVLSDTVDWLAGFAPASVLVDLAALTFADSALPKFVIRIRRAAPPGAELILWRANPATSWVLKVTDMAAIATIREAPDAPLAMVPLSSATRNGLSRT